MNLLPHNCRRSDIKVFPENWEDKNADISIAWYIYYRFYDPNYKQEFPKGKLVSIRGMNRYTTLKERRESTKKYRDDEETALSKGWNPHTKNSPYKEPEDNKIGPGMPFSAALQFADTKIKVSPETRTQETNHILKQLLETAKKQGLSNKPIKEITRRHLRELIEASAISKTSKEYSRDKYNRCRKVLGYYYKELLDYEVVEANIPASIKKQKQTIARAAASISPENQKRLSEYLRDNYRPFWLYMQCFYGSAPRSTEMMRLKVSDVDLAGQRIKFIILKGDRPTERYRVIPDYAVKYWKEVIGDAKGDMYVFSEGLQPGETPIKAYQIHKRWRRLITLNEDFNNIGITFYKLKHMRITDVADSAGQDQAANLAGESKKMVQHHYDLNPERENDKLKKIGREF